MNGEIAMDMPAPRFTMTMLMWLKPDGAAALATFRQQAAPLFETYGLRVERVLKLSGKGQIVGDNRMDVPQLAQTISFPSAEQFKAYVSDPQYQALAQQRDLGLQRMVVVAGTPLDVSAIATPGNGPLEERLYGVGLVRFKPGGSAGLDAFNLRAQALFARHGMHVESMLEVKQTLAPVGDAQGVDPQRVVVFFLDNAAAMKGYATDPEYAALAPLRDTGLESYDFFTGAMVLP
jgi:uncharacterized protein (DUF1330 family)